MEKENEIQKLKLSEIDQENKSENGIAKQDIRGCSHYKRKAKFVSPCCGKIYVCRYCHDEVEDHTFNRKTVTELICTECATQQKVQTNCQNCGIRFGRYTCLICNLFDDDDKSQYHCEFCGICRVGGKDRFFHCATCNMCLPVQLQIDGHRCVENVSRSNCAVCLEDIHTSRIPCHIPSCGHLLHRTCFEQLLVSGYYACPTCQQSMLDMKQLWDYLDNEVVATPMPKEYDDFYVDILCKDCHQESTVIRSNNFMLWVLNVKTLSVADTTRLKPINAHFLQRQQKLPMIPLKMIQRMAQELLVLHHRRHPRTALPSQHLHLHFHIYIPSKSCNT